jgi:hypothetical protein
MGVIGPGPFCYLPISNLGPFPTPLLITYSLLKALEDIFDTDGYLGYAGAPGLVGFFGCVTSDIATKDRHTFSSCGRR